MVSDISIQDALNLNWPIIDVRSQGEFERGHIVGATNIALFSNDERAHVGTVYKQQSREAAIALGYEYVTPKLQQYIDESFKLAPDGKVIIHCWRGGMRSRSFAQHLSDNGFTDVRVITKGYKAFRNYVIESLATPAPLKVLGGYTGSGKTYILEELKKLGHQTIDLEGLAHHKGSAFGAIGQPEQPSSEQFENLLFEEWRKLDLNKHIWVEDESLAIGKVQIPQSFYEQMRNSTLYFIDIPAEERAKHLVEDYTHFGNEVLAESISRIAQRLGGLNTQMALTYLEEQNFYEVAKIALLYYDKYYLKGMNKRTTENVIKLSLPNTNHYENALEIEKIHPQPPKGDFGEFRQMF